MANNNIELRAKLCWWVIPFLRCVVIASKFAEIDENKVIEIAERGVYVEVVK